MVNPSTAFVDIGSFGRQVELSSDDVARDIPSSDKNNSDNSNKNNNENN
jgi:hypothetical protein